MPVNQSYDANVVEQSVTKETTVTVPHFEVSLIHCIHGCSVVVCMW